MFRFRVRSASCSSRLTGGTTYGPIAAGVRSTSVLPYGASRSALARCACADVASKTIEISSKPSLAISPSTPSEGVGTPNRAARASPSEAGSRRPTPPGARQPVGIGIDADHRPHLEGVGLAQTLNHQVGANVAGADDGHLRLRHLVLRGTSVGRRPRR